MTLSTECELRRVVLLFSWPVSDRERFMPCLKLRIRQADQQDRPAQGTRGDIGLVLSNTGWCSVKLYRPAQGTRGDKRPFVLCHLLMSFPHKCVLLTFYLCSLCSAFNHTRLSLYTLVAWPAAGNHFAPCFFPRRAPMLSVLSAGPGPGKHQPLLPPPYDSSLTFYQRGSTEAPNEGTFEM